MWRQPDAGWRRDSARRKSRAALLAADIPAGESLPLRGHIARVKFVSGRAFFASCRGKRGARYTPQPLNRDLSARPSFSGRAGWPEKKSGISTLSQGEMPLSLFSCFPTAGRRQSRLLFAQQLSAAGSAQSKSLAPKRRQAFADGK